MSGGSRWKSPFQRTKRERQQPAARASLGFLEKKKDYVKRAERAHRKEKFVSELQREAALKNPDEFYFSMITDAKKTKLETKTKPLREFTKEQKLLLESRDQGYIQLKLESHRRKLEALSMRLPQRTQTSQRIFASVEEALKAKEEEQRQEAEEGEEIAELRREVEDRRRVVRELEEVWNEMQLQKDLKQGEAKQIEDDEGNVSFVWKKERKR
jgi:U3 small nucleolar RNA-associated protein 11